MRTPSAWVVFLAVAVLATGSAASHARTGGPPSRGEKLAATLATLVSQADAPGGVLVVRSGSTTWRGAAGRAQIEPQRKMTVSGRFRVASVTKIFTASLVLQLAGERILSLEDPVERWLPGRLPGEAGAKISIRQLLQHTSGLVDETVEWIPGEAGTFVYANRNYELLGEIVSAATGSTYGDLLVARLLRPLGLTRTELSPLAAPPADLVHGYTPSRPRLDVTRLPWPGPAAGLISTAADLMRFERALNGRRVISGELLDAMYTPVSTGPWSSRGYDAYGLGLMRFPAACGAAWGHRGLHSGYVSWLLWTRDGKRTAVALLNVGYALGDSPTQRRLSRLVTRALCT